MTYHVTHVRKEQARDHEHIIGVVTTAGLFHTNQQVHDSLGRGDSWYTSVPGVPDAAIEKLSYCPNATCYHKPYLRTRADATARNNLENLPRG